MFHWIYFMSRLLAVLSVLSFPVQAYAQGSLWRTYYDSGVKQRTEGNHAKALSLLKSALSEAQSAKNQRRVSETKNQLGIVYRSMSKYTQAETMLKDALKWARKQTDRDGRTFQSSVLNNLGNVYSDMEQYTQAEKCLRESINISEKLNPYRNPELATRFNNLGLVYCGMKKWSQAELLFTRSIAISEKYDGPSDPSTAVSLYNLAFLYRDTSRSAKAEPIFRRVLLIYVKAYGWDHTDTLDARDCLAGILIRLGRSDEADYVRGLPESLGSVEQANEALPEIDASDWVKE